MQVQSTLKYEKLLNLAYLLPKEDKKRLIKDLQNNIVKQEDRKFGNYDVQGWIKEDFNEPLEEYFRYNINKI
jgi:hypothetical protein